jgi:hypothetical protein
MKCALKRAGMRLAWQRWWVGGFLVCSCVVASESEVVSGKHALREEGAQAHVSDAASTQAVVGVEAATATAVHELPAVPFGRWRLADPRDLRHVVLWLSHVLIRHSESLPRAVSFSIGDWDAAPAPPARSRDEALAIALQIAAKAEAQPGEFTKLAQRHSDDASTREYGGSLGGIIASQLSAWPAVLDVIAAARPSGVTGVVETDFGFHVFKRNPEPDRGTVTGAHIVIGYEEARWLQSQKCKEIPRRSRDEALAIASDVFRRVLNEPQSFESLVKQYSESCDALQGGDLGSWYSHEPTYIPMEVQVLQGLAVGEVAAPLDSKLGFQIIKRTPNRKRKQYAVDAIYLGFDPARPEVERWSRASVHREATTLAQELALDPSRFASVKKERWLGPVERYAEGQGFPLLNAALAQTEFGQVTPHPIEWGVNYVIGKRIDPATLPPLPPIHFELPAPAAPNLDYFAAYMKVPFFAAQLKLVAERERDARELKGKAAAEFIRLHEAWAQYEVLSREERTEMFRKLQERVRKLLGTAPYATYVQHLNQHFESLLLTPSTS